MKTKIRLMLAITAACLIGFGCNITIPPLPDIPPIVAPTNAPPVVPDVPPVVVPTNTPPVIPPVAATALRIGMFSVANPGEANNHGFTSSLDQRYIHNEANENERRLAMYQHKKTDGANTLDYVFGSAGKGNIVLDMALDGRAHPGDGHYFPIKAPTATAGEVDWAMWGKQAYGVSHHLVWIWNDDGSMPVNASTVNTAVDAYSGTRLGMSNVIFGVCLEANEIMSAAQGAAMLAAIKSRSPTSPRMIGSASTDFLKQVAQQTDANVYLWVEQEGNPVMLPRRNAMLLKTAVLKVPLTKSTFPQFLDKCDTLAAAVPGGKSRVIPGEYAMLSSVDRVWSVQQAAARGYAIVGGGVWP